MSTNNSNALQRNRSIRNATLLVLLLMLLAGVGGSFFPASRQLKNMELGQDFAGRVDYLEQLDLNCRSFVTSTQKLEKKYGEIEQKDRDWAKAADQAGLKREIRGLEDDLTDLVNALKKESRDTLLTPFAVNAYAALISARGTIWDCREIRNLPPPPSGDPVSNLKQKAWMLAQQLDQKAGDIRKVIPQIRRDKNDRRELETYVQELASLANQLRSI